jgi:hypothetical protein
VYNLHVPQAWQPNSQTVWRYLNRTLYRSEPSDQQEWLRNHKKKSELQMRLLKEYKQIVYPEALFYKTHRISTADFVNKLE